MQYSRDQRGTGRVADREQGRGGRGDLPVAAQGGEEVVELGALDRERLGERPVERVLGRCLVPRDPLDEIDFAERKLAPEERRALPYKQDLIAAPDCGMKYLPREVAFGKMRAMVEGAKLLRAEYA